MQEQIRKWYRWLKRATAPREKKLRRVYSDGRQLWATDGYSLHARPIALGRQGSVSVGKDGLLAVNETHNRLPNFADAVPQEQPLAVVVVERDRLQQALAGQDRFVQLAVYARGRGMAELSSTGAYALIMSVVGLEEEDFWRPDTSEP